MKPLASLVVDTLISGAIAGVATSAAVAALGQARERKPLGPINATSHIVWGEEAGRVDDADLKHTLPGAALNLGACVFWAGLYEAWFGDRKRVADVVAGGPAVAAIAYVVDYHVVPKRLTPGWEYRLSPRDLTLVYAAVAASLPLRRLFAR